MTTDTPRTDALWAKGNTGEEELDELCRQLERELAHSLENQVKSQAEVERLKKENIHLELEWLEIQDINAWIGYEFQVARKMREKAESEVEKLKGQLQQAVDIAEWYMDNLIDSPRKDKLNQIKATFNQEKK